MLGETRDSTVSFSDEVFPFQGRGKNELERLGPSLVAGVSDTIDAERFVDGAEQAIAEPEGTENASEAGLGVVDEAFQNRVDRVEVRLQRKRSISVGNGCGSDAEVERDMGVHAQEQMLQGDKTPICGELESGFPRGGERLFLGEGSVGVEVTVCEHDIESLHARIILKRTFFDGNFDGNCNPTVESREVAHRRSLADGLFDDGVEFCDDLVDGFRHGRKDVVSRRWSKWD